MPSHMLQTNSPDIDVLGRLRTRKRGRICIAESQGACLVGEATLTDCVCVGVFDQTTQRWTPADSSELAHANFLFSDGNTSKHQIDHPGLHPMFESSRRLFAWVLDDVVPYNKPVAYHPKQGAVIFVDLAGRIPSDRHSAPCCLLFWTYFDCCFVASRFFSIPRDNLLLCMHGVAIVACPVSGTHSNGCKCCIVCKSWWTSTWSYIGSCTGLHVHTASAPSGCSCCFNGRSA